MVWLCVIRQFLLGPAPVFTWAYASFARICLREEEGRGPLCKTGMASASILLNERMTA